MEQIVGWATIIGVPISLIGLVISFVSLRKQYIKIKETDKNLGSLKDIVSIHTQFINSQSNSYVTNIQINRGDLSATEIATLFAQLPRGN